MLILPIVPQTSHSTRLPFIKPVEVLQVSSNGRQYRDDSLGLCIDVPKGAVPEGRLLQLEIGMCLYGPFRFPNNLPPIAPILMLYPHNDVKLSKRLQITLPHIIEDAKDNDVDTLGIKVIKADHMSFLKTGLGIFNTVIGGSNLHFYSNIDYHSNLATFSLTHCCFITIQAKESKEVAKRKGYCVCPLLPPPKDVSSGIFTFYFCITYFMKPCLIVSTIICLH